MSKNELPPLIDEFLRFAHPPHKDKHRIYITVCMECGPVTMSENESMSEIVCHKCRGNKLRIIRDAISEMYPGMFLEGGGWDV